MKEDINPQLKQDLIDFVKKRLGRIKAFELYEELKKCPCEPCATVRTILEIKP